MFEFIFGKHSARFAVVFFLLGKFFFASQETKAHTKRALVISLDGLDTRYLHDADKYKENPDATPPHGKRRDGARNVLCLSFNYVSESHFARDGARAIKVLSRSRNKFIRACFCAAPDSSRRPAKKTSAPPSAIGKQPFM